MATSVYDVEELTLQDGKSYEFKPLNLKLLKKFMTAFDNIGEPSSQSEGLEQLRDLTAICLEAVDKELAGDTERLDEILDTPTMYRIIEISTGIKLNDENLIRAAMMEQMAREAGEN